MRAITGKKDKGKQAASTNTTGRFETDILTQRENLTSLSAVNGRWVQKEMGKTNHRRIILDMDRSKSPVHGEQKGKYVLNWAWFSCKRFVSNQVRLWLFVLAYNLGNFLRRLAFPKKIKHWSLRSLLTRFIKNGAKVVRHSRYVTFQMAEVSMTNKIFTEILYRIDQLRYRTV